MSLRMKFSLAVVGCLAVVMSAGVWHLNRQQTHAFEQEARNRTEIVLSFGQACRAYVKKVLRPEVQKHTDKMIFEAMSSTFATRGIMEFFNEKMPEYSYKQPTLNPLNLTNKATKYEAELVKRFQEDRELEELTGYHVTDGEDRFYVARPIIVEEKCLKCHGAPDAVPASITQKYGRAHGYHWKTGEVVASVMISVPTADLVAQQSAMMTALLQTFGALTLILLLSGHLFFERLVNRRVGVAAKVMAEVETDATSPARIIDSSRDELGAMGQAFNSMADSLRDSHSLLERRVEERTSELASAESRIRSIVEAAADGIITADEHGTIMSFNKAAESIFGHVESDIVGQSVAGLFPQATLDDHAESSRLRFNSGDGDAVGHVVECAGLHKNGNEMALALAISVVQAAGKRIFTGIVRDMTERNRAELELREAKDKAEAATQAKGDFLANMSHEIRTPMNGIIGMSELTLDTELDTEQRDYVNTILECANSLLALLNDILDFSKMEAGKLELETIDFDLLASVEGVADLFAQRAAEKNLELICTTEPSVPRWLRGDPIRLRQVLINLTGNAIKFTENGEVVVSAKLETETEDGVSLVFSVRDTGIGIPKDRQDAIFESFTQVDGATTRKYGGTGLGLAISKQIVDVMEGDLWIESEPGQGSSFNFRITMPRASQPVHASGEPVSITANTGVLRRKRLLVIDDNATNRRILRIVLESWGCQVEMASSGQAGLEKIKDAHGGGTPFDLVLLDLQMPEMDGFEVEQAARENPIYGNPTTVVLSSLGREEMRAGRGMECAAFLSKPVKQSSLMQALVTVFGNREPVGSVPSTGQFLGETTVGGSVARVLLVDDNAVNRKVAVNMLQKWGCDVTTAENGRVALNVLDTKEFDVVLMDVQMPEMDGLEATRCIRADQKIRHLPVIAMTARAMKGDRERCIESGMDDYITKPVKAKELREIVTKWMKGAQPVAQIPGESLAEITGGTEDRTPSQAAVNIEQAMSNLEGDRGLLSEVLKDFVELLPELLGDLKDAVRAADSERVEQVAHCIAGAAANVCADPVHGVAAHIERLGRSRSPEPIEPLLADLSTAFESLRGFANSWKA